MAVALSRSPSIGSYCSVSCSEGVASHIGGNSGHSSVAGSTTVGSPASWAQVRWAYVVRGCRTMAESSHASQGSIAAALAPRARRQRSSPSATTSPVGPRSASSPERDSSNNPCSTGSASTRSPRSMRARARQLSRESSSKASPASASAAGSCSTRSHPTTTTSPCGERTCTPCGPTPMGCPAGGCSKARSTNASPWHKAGAAHASRSAAASLNADPRRGYTCPAWRRRCGA